MMEEKEDVLEIHIRNSAPVELEDLALSMNAIAKEFSGFCQKRNKNESVKLYLNEVRKGSIVMDLIAVLPVMIPTVVNFNSVCEFAGYMKAMFLLLTKTTNEKPDGMDAESLKNFRDITAPVMKDSKSSMSISIVNSPNANVFVDGNSAQMRLASNTAKAMEDMMNMPAEDFIQKAVLFITQLRDGERSVGDRGVIQSVCNAPKKIISMDDKFKESILGSPDNAFNFGYIVDVVVVKNGDSVVAYRVTKFYERFVP